ncbi:MAG: sulfotransferase family protein [Planctomycetota bacterium]
MTQLIFLGGSPRSGTTLLQNTLDSHSLIASGPDLNIIPLLAKTYRTFLRFHGPDGYYLDSDKLKDTFNTMIHSFFADYAKRKSKPIVLDKTPLNLLCFDMLAETVPDAKFIHIIRDGRDVACSHVEIGRRLIRKRKALPIEHFSIYHAAEFWNILIRIGNAICGDSSPLARENRCITVRYEDLVTNPKSELMRVCEFLGVEFQTSMLEHHRLDHDNAPDGFAYTEEKFWRPVSEKNVGRWKREMGPLERIIFAAAAQEGLEIAGYVNGKKWVGEGARLPGFIFRSFRYVGRLLELLQRSRFDALSLRIATLLFGGKKNRRMKWKLRSGGSPDFNSPAVLSDLVTRKILWRFDRYVGPG